MSKTYKIHVNNSFETELSESDILNANIVELTDSKYHIINNSNSYKATIIEADFIKKLYKVTINNTVYSVNIFNDLDVQIKKMGFEVGTTKQVNNIKAPMPGLILDISVKIGQEIKEDDTLLILEAMKMENVLTSPRNGIIKSISVSKGDAVEKNQLLIEFDD